MFRLNLFVKLVQLLALTVKNDPLLTALIIIHVLVTNFYNSKN